MKSILIKNQKKKITVNNVMYENERVDLIITLRYDDECGNGHNSFSITGDVYKTGKRYNNDLICCGCCHDIIKELAPEYEKYIKWHLMGSDEPIHYVANTLYHARTKDCWGCEKGEVKSTKKKIVFDGLPISFEKSVDFIKYLESTGQNEILEIEEVTHKDSKTFGSKYTFKGFSVEWYKCPFDDIKEAEEWKEALKLNTFKIVEVPYSWGVGSEADLESARISAISPNATLEQLQDEDWLKARIPNLRKEFKLTVESLGFTF